MKQNQCVPKLAFFPPFRLIRMWKALILSTINVCISVFEVNEADKRLHNCVNNPVFPGGVCTLLMVSKLHQ